MPCRSPLARLTGMANEPYHACRRRARALILNGVPGSVIPCVGAIIKDDQGRLLLIKRGHEPGAGLWSIPGGRIEPGETDAEALVREMQEETGLAVQAGPLLGSVRRPAQDGERPRHQGLRGHGHRRNAPPGRRRGRGALGGGQRPAITADHGRFGRSAHQLGCSGPGIVLIVLFHPFRHSCEPVVTSDVQRHALELIPTLYGFRHSRRRYPGPR